MAAGKKAGPKSGREGKTGNRGGPRTKLTSQQKILMGKGAYRSIKTL